MANQVAQASLYLSDRGLLRDWPLRGSGLYRDALCSSAQPKRNALSGLFLIDQ